ncbi:hypothetical protein L1987_11488 [Smallanthus sonchifolius]|uniref:Uncharacterized protein n=1 Tax=Smallanthus sonchifolius TaxID=185202 RepID=A0ACB9JD95_9ASTR|nr:hypothetical protein L1987_11488 [Smallanthus sonchifolius]
MGRAKLRMELIAKEKTRNTTYHKRKDGMLKKANEFTILCDVDTVIIIYPPHSHQPVIWPENPDKIKKAIASYKKKLEDESSRNRSYDLNDFLEDRMKKIEEELVKARKRNMEAKYPTWFDGLDGLDDGQLRQFAMELEIKRSMVQAHLEFKKRNMAELMFGIENMQGLDHHAQLMNQQYARGWFNDAPMALGLGYPVYDNLYPNPNPNQWVFPAPVVHGGVMQEFARQEHESQVNINGVGDFVMDDH